MGSSPESQCPSWPGHPLGPRQIPVTAPCLPPPRHLRRCPTCRLVVIVGLLRNSAPWEEVGSQLSSLPPAWQGGGWTDRPLQPPQPRARLHTHVLASLCRSARKFKPRVKFIVSISFILSIVLHFIICCDILNGACHSILTTARGYSHLLCQAFSAALINDIKTNGSRRRHKHENQGVICIFRLCMASKGYGSGECCTDTRHGCAYVPPCIPAYETCMCW